MQTRSDRSLESLKFFPFIAWSIFLLFAAFVYTLTYQLKDVTVAIESSESYQAAVSVENSGNTTPETSTQKKSN